MTEKQNPNVVHGFEIYWHPAKGAYRVKKATGTTSPELDEQFGSFSLQELARAAILRHVHDTQTTKKAS